jgi:glycosyltransferase involved in cell wall biosynthesis
VDRGKVVISPMGVERKLLDQQEKKEKPYVQILSNRKLEPLYDVATLIKSIPLVIEQIPKEVRFIILGEGSHKDHLVDLARKLKIEKYVEFKGMVTRDELLEYYRDSDVYVSTSLSDSTSVSLLEAMNFGLIPIVTDIFGNREWIQDQRNGFLFPPSDSEALAEKIIHVVNEFRHGERFRKENEAIIRERAVWEENMKNVEREFSKLACRG